MRLAPTGANTRTPPAARTGRSARESTSTNSLRRPQTHPDSTRPHLTLPNLHSTQHNPTQPKPVRAEPSRAGPQSGGPYFVLLLDGQTRVQHQHHPASRTLRLDVLAYPLRHGEHVAHAGQKHEKVSPLVSGGSGVDALQELKQGQKASTS